MICTIGNFDGVHLGHQAMIQTLVAQAKAKQKPSLVLVFEPQPQEFFSKTPPARLTTFHEKCVLLKAMGVDEIQSLHFDEALSRFSPEDFLKTILNERFKVEHLIVGDDFRFGHQKRGDLAVLEALGPQYGFTTQGLGSIMVGLERVSSTRVREALHEGDFALAERLLGRPYSMRGVVQKGDQRGRLLGYPTANLDPNRVKVPLTGVYAVKCRHWERSEAILSGSGLLRSARNDEENFGNDEEHFGNDEEHFGNDEEHFGMANIGTRPTVDGSKTLLEVNIFEFNDTIYGQEIEVQFCHKIRDEQRFDSLEALKAQLKADKTAVESYFRHG